MKLIKNAAAAIFLTSGLAAMACAATSAESVVVSTEAASVETLYSAGKLRDPFIKPGSVAAPKIAADAAPEEFSIHNLSLRAIMKDAAADYALFQDMNATTTYILRKGKLYGPKDKIIGGVIGTINLKQKGATLMTPDKDVQVFRLGEDEKEKDKNP